MRPQFFPTLVLGLLLVYLGTFGLAGLGVTASLSWSKTSLPSREEFQNLNAWTPESSGAATASIQAVGPSDGSSLYLDSGSGGVAEVDGRGMVSVASVNQWTMFVSARITAFGYGGSFETEFLTGSYLLYVTITSGAASFGDGSQAGLAIDNNWHLYILQVTGGNAHFFLDGSSISSFNCPSWTGVTPTIILKAFSGTQVNVDYLELDSGIQTAPTLAGNSVPTQNTAVAGSILVNCTKTGVGPLQGVTVTAGNSSQWSEVNTTIADGTTVLGNLSPGNYGVSASKAGETPLAPTAVTVTAGTQTIMTITFAASVTTNPTNSTTNSTDDQNPTNTTTTTTTTVTTSNSTVSNSTFPNININWNQIWQNINNLVDANRQPLSMIGALIALVSFVGFLLPPRRIPISI